MLSCSAGPNTATVQRYLVCGRRRIEVPALAAASGIARARGRPRLRVRPWLEPLEVVP